MRTRGRTALTILTVAFVLGAAVPARAHSFPEQESPSAGQTLSAPPGEVSIKFDAPIENLFAKIEVDGADGKNYAVGDPTLTSDGRTLSIKLGKLAPGVYTVKWAVVCIDTHHTNGSYIFTVKGPGA